ncbi:lipopolysaccharide biosynthesis protein [Maritimibacter sp. 55A14]|uniref:lipopolysaccharide biosynthesis protein n=1 Tax=Maritimibacter sp. 55A14 TaxID=2174844 RepID=UPI001304AA9D|nr:lipopolysaccharide biosynthesis protein [Maritimibacter sp. 55A14]
MTQAPTPASTERIWHRLRRNAGVILGGRAIFGLVNLAAAAVAVRAVGIEGFGLVALLQAYIRVIAGFIRFDSWAAVTRYGAVLMEFDRPSDLRRLMGFTLRLDIIAFAIAIVIAILAAPLAAKWLHWPDEVTALVPWYAVTILFITGATPTGFLRLVDRFRVLAEQHALNAVIRLLGAALVLSFGGGVVALLGVWAAAGIVSGCYMFAVAWQEARQRDLMPRMRGQWSVLSDGFPRIWRFVALTNGTAIVETVTSHATVLIVGGMLGPTGASLFALVRQITESMAKLRSLLGPIVFPEIAGLEARGQRHRVRRLVRRTLLVSVLIVGLIVGVLVFAAEPLLVLLFGPESASAAPLLLGAGAAASLAASGFALAPAMLCVGKEVAVFRTALIATLLFLPVLLLLLNVAGLTGAGIALLLWQGTIFFSRILILRRALRRPA